MDMESEIINQNYELAYHLNPDIEELEVMARVKEIQDLIIQERGSVLVSRDPKRKHLSYPIKHKHYSYFGVFDFSASPETIEKINTQIKLQNDVLRCIILKKESKDKDLRVLGTERPRARMKTHEPLVLSPEELEKAAKQKEEIKPEQIEKEIEEALEKI